MIKFYYFHLNKLTRNLRRRFNQSRTSIPNFVSSRKKKRVLEEKRLSLYIFERYFVIAVCQPFPTCNTFRHIFWSRFVFKKLMQQCTLHLSSLGSTIYNIVCVLFFLLKEIVSVFWWYFAEHIIIVYVQLVSLQTVTKKNPVKHALFSILFIKLQFIFSFLSPFFFIWDQHYNDKRDSPEIDNHFYVMRRGHIN